VAGVVVMLDIEFLINREISGIVLYRYQSGFLRPAMLALARELSKQSGRIVETCTAGELIQTWCGGTLFPAIRVCDLPSPNEAQCRFKRLKTLFSCPPDDPTIIMMRATHYNRGHHPGATLVEEPVVSEKNVAYILKYLADTSDLKNTNVIYGQKSFQKYFRDWVRTEEQVSLPQLKKEFDRSILLYSSPDSREFTPPTAFDPDPAQQSFLMQALGRLLDNPAAAERAAMMQALSLRKSRGATNQALVEDLLFASLKLVKARCAARCGSQGSIAASPDAAMLWATLLMMWSRRITSARPESGKGRPLPVLIMLDHLLREFVRRLADIYSDPLDGYWSDLKEALPRHCEADPADTKMDPRAELSRVLFAESTKRHHALWLDKLNRLGIVARRRSTLPTIRWFANVDPNLDLGNFDEIIGQPQIVDELRRRVLDERHERPLLLAGPPGSGKRSIARLYAKLLLCEGRPAKSLDPCGCCEQCKAFASSSPWGYLEFDMAHVNILDNARYHINQLRYQPFSERRVVILRDPDRSDEATDAFLKTLETGARVTTSIILTRDECAVRASALSRSDRFHTKTIVGSDARKLIERWLPAVRADKWLVDVIALHGLGRPGLMWHLSQMVMKASAWTLDAVKDLFDVGWGERAIEYLCALLGNQEDLAERLLLQIDADPSRAVLHIRTVLHQIVAGGGISEASLVGLEERMTAASGALDRSAANQGLTSEALWTHLVNHWLRDLVIDAASLVEAGKQAQLIVGGLFGSPPVAFPNITNSMDKNGARD
jgi:hypothetical protein